MSSSGFDLKRGTAGSRGDYGAVYADQNLQTFKAYGDQDAVVQKRDQNADTEDVYYHIRSDGDTDILQNEVLFIQRLEAGEFKKMGPLPFVESSLCGIPMLTGTTANMSDEDRHAYASAWVKRNLQTVGRSLTHKPLVSRGYMQHPELAVQNGGTCTIPVAENMPFGSIVQLDIPLREDMSAGKRPGVAESKYVFVARRWKRPGVTLEQEGWKDQYKIFNKAVQDLSVPNPPPPAALLTRLRQDSNEKNGTFLGFQTTGEEMPTTAKGTFLMQLMFSLYKFRQNVLVAGADAALSEGAYKRAIQEILSLSTGFLMLSFQNVEGSIIGPGMKNENCQVAFRT